MRDLGVQVEGAPCPGFFRPDAEIGLFVVELDCLVLAFMSLVRESWLGLLWFAHRPGTFDFQMPTAGI